MQDAGFKSLRQQIDLLQNALKEDNQAIIDYQRQVGRVFDTQDKTNENLEALRHQRDGRDVAAHVAALTPARARAIGEAARARIARDHTYAHRAVEVDSILKAEAAAKRARGAA